MSLLQRIPVLRRLVAPRLATPRWRGPHAGPRVLLEEPDTVLSGAIASALRDDGYQVVECEGPDSPRAARCPLLVDGSCDAVHGADLVVQVGGRDRPGLRRVRAAIAEREPDLPIAVIRPGPRSSQAPPRAPRTTWVSTPLTRKGVVAAVRAVGTRPH